MLLELLRDTDMAVRHAVLDRAECSVRHSHRVLDTPKHSETRRLADVCCVRHTGGAEVEGVAGAARASAGHRYGRQGISCNPL